MHAEPRAAICRSLWIARCAASQRRSSPSRSASGSVGSVTRPDVSIWKYARISGSVGPCANGEGVTDGPSDAPLGS